MTDLFQDAEFTDQVLDDNKDYLTELVGEGKKFSDPQALARGKFEADQFVERLKQENAGLRNELNSRVKMEEFLDKLNSSNQPPKSPDAGQQTMTDPAKAETKGLTPEQVLQLLEQREQQKNAETNVNKVKERLQDTLGPNYTSKLKQVANELGLSTEHLTNLASTSPDAFYKLVGIDGAKKPEPFQSPPRNQLMTFTPSNSIRDWNYYEDIRKKEPTRYWTPAVQNQMHSDAMKLGERFKP